MDAVGAQLGAAWLLVNLLFFFCVVRATYAGWQNQGPPARAGSRGRSKRCLRQAAASQMPLGRHFM